jgi:hypothetical protein
VLACGYFKGLDGADATHSCDQVGEKSEWRHKLDLRNVMAYIVNKKCDARQPCMTCVDKNKSAACKYEGSRSSGNVPPTPPMSQSKDVLAGSGSNESGSSCYLEKVDQIPLSDVSVVQKILDVAEWSPRSTGSSFTILPSIHFRAIPRPLQIPLSFIPPERVQVSWVSGNDRDMTLYVFSLRFLEFSSDRRD